MNIDTNPEEPVAVVCMKCAPQLIDLQDRLNDRIEQLGMLQGRYNRLASAAREKGIDIQRVSAKPDQNMGPRIQVKE
jgi:hypothetical protein